MGVTTIDHAGQGITPQDLQDAYEEEARREAAYWSARWPETPETDEPAPRFPAGVGLCDWCGGAGLEPFGNPFAMEEPACSVCCGTGVETKPGGPGAPSPSHGD